MGGIGITNIMLVGVAERTQEIGLCKAVGARRADILLQFLVEAVTLSLVGGVAGVLLTALLINVGAIALHTLLPTVGAAHYLMVDNHAVGLALGFASMVGLVAGVYPAILASNLVPITALRSR